MKPAVLTFVKYYLPGYKSGGPVRTLSNMVDHLGDYIDFRVVTYDRDSGDTVPYSGIQVNRWNTVGNTLVYYVSPGSCTISHFRQLIRETRHDVMYVNSFFDQDFSLRPLIARRLDPRVGVKTVIAPRGEFSAGALDLKRLRKRMFVAGTRVCALHRDVVWQASSEHEREDILRALGHLRPIVKIGPDLPPILSHSDNHDNGWDPRPEHHPLRVCFLSRISPMKNLHYALEMLHGVTVPVHLDVYGMVADKEYMERCQGIARGLPSHISVRWNGAVPHEDVQAVLSRHDLFLLPTLGENYGHVIHEALGASVPVLISDRTPWRDLGGKGVGWDLSLENAEQFRAKIEYVYNLPPEKLKAMRLRAREVASEVTCDDLRVRQNRDIFLQMTAAA